MAIIIPFPRLTLSLGKTRRELVKRLYLTILIVGGSTLFPGFKEVLEERICERLPENTDVQTVEVHSNK